MYTCIFKLHRRQLLQPGYPSRALYICIGDFACKNYLRKLRKHNPEVVAPGVNSLSQTAAGSCSLGSAPSSVLTTPIDTEDIPTWERLLRPAATWGRLLGPAAAWERLLTPGVTTLGRVAEGQADLPGPPARLDVPDLQAGTHTLTINTNWSY